jgi:wyosine [tRNA(Phe)-imidazoG37] synthetase (radical SAM superfamily)
MSNQKMIAFGPVPSRRLGHSLGINNIPPKICSYSCIYCQLGRTLKIQVARKEFYTIEEIFKAVESKVREAQHRNEKIDYLTFVPDGEPTLDINLGKEIEILKQLDIKIAVITNASLIWDWKVRDDLLKADWVSLKIDAITKEVWHEINRPHTILQQEDIFEGMRKFANAFKGELTTETMLIQNTNTDIAELRKIADFCSKLKPTKCYISIPTRPPAEKWVVPANENIINIAYQIFKEKSNVVEYIIGYEGNEFAFTGNIEKDLLSITSVHPMRKDGVQEFLKKANASWDVIDKLLDEEKLIELNYLGKNFYIRKLPKGTKLI